MKKIKIGYWPLSQDFSSPGDRRRVIFWAQARGHEIVTDLNQKVDVIIASEKSDFNSASFAKTNTPVIFDLIDAYLSPTNLREDISRGIAHRLTGQISGRVKSFSANVRDFCLSADAVICSSVEQEKIISQYNSNTHIILDSHDELPFNVAKYSSLTARHDSRILWEGQPATIRGVREISTALCNISKNHSLQFDFVTDEKYFQFLGKYIQRNTLTLLKKDLNGIFEKVNISSWTLNNLVDSAQRSSIAMIPIDLSVPIQNLKPENRLLIMWRLGLPCLTSASPAYLRVANQAGTLGVSEDLDSWESNFELFLNDPRIAFTEIERGQTYLNENHTKSILLNKWDQAIESVLK